MPQRPRSWCPDARNSWAAEGLGIHGLRACLRCIDELKVSLAMPHRKSRTFLGSLNKALPLNQVRAMRPASRATPAKRQCRQGEL